MGFTKLDERILQSSIMAEDSDTFKVWIALLASCRETGIAYVSSVYLSSVCRLPIESVNSSIEKLSNPDQNSRSLTDEGRRIRRTDGGYEIINYKVYRGYSYSLKEEAVRKREYRKRTPRGTLGHNRDIVPNVMGHSASASVLSSILFNTNKSIWEGITDNDMKGWGEAYPACDINSEFAKMGEWILANPKKGKKSNYRRFIVNWLSRAQDQGGSHPKERASYDRKGIRLGDNIPPVDVFKDIYYKHKAEEDKLNTKDIKDRR